MVKMKVQDFITKAIQVEKVPTLYGWGKFMNSYNGNYFPFSGYPHKIPLINPEQSQSK